MIAPVLLDTDDDSTIPDCVALATIERLAAEQSAALLHATATGGDDEAAAIAGQGRKMASEMEAQP